MQIPDRDTKIHRQLVDGLSDHAIYMLDADGNILSWNAGAERLTGYAEREAIGAPVTMLHELGPPSAEVLTAARQHGRHEGRVWRRRKDGVVFTPTA